MQKQDMANGLDSAINSASYVFHALREKPVMVAVSAILAPVIQELTRGLPNHIISLLALTILTGIDWYTKVRACRVKGEPVTSRIMREKGFPKLRDYFVLYIAGAMTIPLMGDVWGHRSVLFALSIWELWSIAENLYDAGTIPFDIRRIALFDGVRQLLAGSVAPTPYTPPASGGGSLTSGPAIPPASPSDATQDGGNLPV